MHHQPILRSLLLLPLVAACQGGDRPPSNAETPRPPAGGASESVIAVGEQKYQQICITCHQANGQGTPGVYPPLAGSEHLNGDPRIPIAIVLHGLHGPVTVRGETFDSVMQPWGMLPDADVAAVLTYARQAWGNNAGPVTAEQVAEVRAAHAGRGAWTIAELRQTFARD